MAQNRNDGPQAASVSKHAQVALFNPITAPTLRSVDPIHVENVFKERERYELEVESKKDELPSLKAIQFTSSTDRSLLKHLVFMWCFDEVDPEVTFEELTIENIEAYLRGLISKADQAQDLKRLREAMTGLKFPVNIRYSTARIKKYCEDVFERLDEICYGDFKAENPKHTIKILLERVKPPPLKIAMNDRVKLEARIDKNVRLFIPCMTEDAKDCQAFGQQVTDEDSKKEDRATVPGKLKRGGGRPGRCKGKVSDEEKLKKPMCLYPSHKQEGLKHYIKDCTQCTREKKESTCENESKTVRRLTEKHKESVIAEL